MNSVVERGWMTLCSAMKLGVKCRQEHLVHLAAVFCLPARLFGYLDAQQRFTALTQLCAFSYETETIEIHVCAADDGNESSLRANEFVVYDEPLETSKSERTGGLGNRSSF